MKISNRMLIIGALIAAAPIALPTASAWAQAAMGSGSASGAGDATAPAAPGMGDANTVNDATLKQTARAFLKVRQIAQDEESAASGGSADADKQKMMQQAESKKVAAVQDEGLRPEEYNRVMRLVQNDATLKQRFMTYVNQAAVPSNPSNEE